jgi:hypothetical protein
MDTLPVFCEVRNEPGNTTLDAVGNFGGRGPCVRAYNWATLFLGEINTGTRPSRYGGVSKIETIKYVHESCGTQIRERLRWRCPAKTENYRPGFSPERATHINKPVTV